MKSSLGLAVVILALGPAAQPLAAQGARARAIIGSATLDVPFVIDTGSVQAGGTLLWAKGDAPADPVLARFTIRPLEAAWLVSPARPDQQVMLWRAFAGGRINQLQANMVPMAANPRIYCGRIGNAPGCVIDDDGNGTVDRFADAITEKGAGPYHITAMRAPQAAPPGLAYRLIAAEERPQIKVELRNCARDYDRPRYQVRALIDDAGPRDATPFVWHDKDSSLGACPRGQALPSWRGGEVQPPRGGYIAALGPLAFTVGPRGQPTLGLLGPLLPQALYRLEGWALINLTAGPTPTQAQLLALQKFPNPQLMALPGGRVQAGSVAPGSLVATLPFRHAYRGRLTSEVKIATLTSRRSLPAGTLVYGFPSRVRTVFTQNGFAMPEAQSEGEIRNINLELTWCAPVQQPDFVARPTEPFRTAWTASCLPHSNAGTHTIIEGLVPALGVSGVSYDVFTASNPGPVPVKRDDAADDGRPMRVDYLFERAEPGVIILRKQMWLGDDLTSHRLERLFAPDGRARIVLAGTRIDLATTADGKLQISTSGTPEPGEDVELERIVDGIGQ